MAEPTRDEEIRAIWRNPDNRMFYKLLGAAILVAIGVLVGGAIFAGNAVDYQINLFTDVISIGVTVLILDELNRRRDKRDAVEQEEANRRRDVKNAEEALKRQLVMDAASTSNEIAKNAVHQLRRKG